MRVLLSTYGGRGDVEPLVALAVALRDLGAQARVCAPPDFTGRLAEAGVPMVPAGQSARALVHGTRAPSAPPPDVPKIAAGIIAEFLSQVTAAAEGCDAVVTTGLFPAEAGAASAAEKLGIRHVHAAYCPIFLPSPHHPPHPLPGRPIPPDVTDNRVLHEMAVESYNAVFGAALNAERAAIGLPPVDNAWA
ncbi:MAG TPA: glycosyltransferase [Streptosporangiaceae bacterium]|jgi:vancomycin aglycone glucosyltransferase